MVQSKAQTVEEYLNELPPDRREAISKVRQTILKNLSNDFVEVMNWGMITYELPLETYPNTYNKKPLMFAALASQKNHMAVYLMTVYSGGKQEEWFKKEYQKTGKKLDMGKSCVRFKNLDDLPLDLIGEVIKKGNAKSLIELYENYKK